MNLAIKKYIILIQLMLLINFSSYSQTYYAVTDTCCTQSLAGLNINVWYNFVLFTLINQVPCKFGPYDTKTNFGDCCPRYFQYTFSSTIYAIRLHLTSIDINDTIVVYINGLQYNVTNANLSNNVPPNNLGCSWIIGSNFAGNSKICGTTNSSVQTPYVQLDINPGYPINSVEVSELVYNPTQNPNGNAASGVAWDFLFTPCNSTHAASTNTPCPGDTLHLSALSVATVATYTWTGPNNFTDSVQNPIHANMTAADTGWYYVSADTGYCTYIDSVHVGMLPQPQINSITNNSAICTGHNLLLNLSTGPGPQHYLWTGPNGFNDTLQNATRTSIAIADSGYYYIKVTDTNHCHTLDSTYVTTRQGPNLPQLSNNNPCIGDTLKLNITNIQSGVTYIWNGPLSFTNSNTNPTIANALSNRSGYYVCTAYYNNCDLADSTHVNVNPILGAPTASISVSKDTICLGDTAHFSISTTNAGSPITYQWRNNGVSIGTNSNTLNTNNLVNNDVLTCKITSASPCQPIDTAISNAIHIHVQSLAPTSMYITQYPANYIAGATLTYTAYPANPLGLSFKWKKNGHYINGATTGVFSSNTLNIGDSICVVAYSSIPCTQPDSTQACMQIGEGITNLSSTNILIYPNPVENELVIEGAENTSVKVYDVVGRIIYTSSITTNKLTIQTNQWESGAYLIQLLLPDGSREFRKVVKQ